MAARIIQDGEISINGERYQLDGDVSWFDISQPPGKVVIGDTTDASNPLASTWEVTDLRDGIGINVMDTRTDGNRAWWSTAQLRHRGHLVLPILAVTTAADETVADITLLADFKNQIYSCVGTKVHVYSNGADSWGSSVVTLNNDATDWTSGKLYPGDTATDTLVIATGEEVHYATASDTWAVNTTDIKYVVFWNDFLWGIDADGQLYYTDDLSGSWTPDALLPVDGQVVTGLEIARGPDREQHIYAHTRTTLYVHDNVNTRFVPTDLQLPFHPQGGDGHEVFRGQLFNSAGNAIYRFQAGSDQTVVDVVGPDLDDGLPATRRGAISQLLKSHNELLAVIDATTAVSTTTLVTRPFTGVMAMAGVGFSTFGASRGLSHILGWDGRGWEVKWVSPEVGRAISSALVSSSYNAYRMWWAHNQRVYYMQLPVDVINPTQISEQNYDTTATLETPWFDGGVSNQDKLALSLWVDSTHPSSNATLKFEYATDLVESYTTLATKTATGESEYTLPSSSDVTGVTNRYIKFRVTWTRDSTVTATPDLHKMFLTYRKRVPAIFGVRALIKVERTVAGIPPSQQVKNLLAARYSNPLVEVTWRSDDGTNNPQNYYMDVLNLQISDRSGNLGIPSNRVLIEFGEPRQSIDR